MAKPTVIKTPSGDQMVIIPLPEYERLVAAAEDATNVRAYDKAKAKLAAGEEELLPAEMVDRLLTGESKVRVWREHRRMTIKALADAAGLTQPYLSQIETGKREGTIEIFKKLATALRVDVDDIV